MNPRDKHLTKFRAGSHVGPYHLLRYLGNVTIGLESKRETDLFDTRCMRCGYTKEINGKALMQARKRNISTCPHCSKSASEPAVAESAPPCPRCYDLPHRRPVDGPCKCGESYADEQIYVEHFIHDSRRGALAQLIRDNGCREERVEGRKYGAQHRGPYRVSQEYEAMT